MPGFDFENIYEPVKKYNFRFKKEFADKASAFFEDILKKSKVDAAANAKLVTEIDSLKRSIEHLSFRVKAWIALRTFFIIVIVIAVLFCVYSVTQDPINYWYVLAAVAVTALSVYGIVWANPKIKNFRDGLADAKARVCETEGKAWDMMKPLNEQFQWETINDLISQTLSIMDIDRFFSRERLRQLTAYGLEDFGDNCSVVNCQSGSINKNPWVMVDTISQEWKNITYYGYLDIEYETTETYMEDGEFKRRTVTRTQRLTAEHVEPAPVYYHNKLLFYGHYAAPDLSFHRRPMKIANDLFRKRRAIKKLEEKDRDHSIAFTVASNKDFDASFYAVNRNHEHQFALLYSALAQKGTYDLLRDTSFGYGDDFSFQKKKTLNILSSDHLTNTDISLDPNKFRHYDLKYVRKHFLDFSAEYFRSFYFSFAPIFCIPLYQQHDATRDVPSGDPGYKFASKLEYESLANYMKNALVSSNLDVPYIMKIASIYESGKTASVRVNAKSFVKEQRTTYINKFGKDYCTHAVPVNYFVYRPVSSFADLKVCNPGAPDSAAFEAMKGTREWAELVASLRVDASSLVYRRGLAAYKPK